MNQSTNFLILISAFSLILSGCGNTPKQQDVANTTQQVRKVVKDTPHQVGQKGTMSASLIEGFDFDRSYKKAEIIAQVTILEWLGEVTDEDKLETTTFRASLDKTFKNTVDDNLKEIKIIQIGNSNFTFSNSPLFKNGDKLILYLAKSEKEDGYCILGEYTGIFRIVNTSGEDYVVKQAGDCPKLSDAKVDKTGSSETYNLEAMENLIKEQKNK